MGYITLQIIKEVKTLCGKRKVKSIPQAAAPVAEPVETTISNLDTEGQQHQRKAKGKKKLIVNMNIGTGVNI